MIPTGGKNYFYYIMMLLSTCSIFDNSVVIDICIYFDQYLLEKLKLLLIYAFQINENKG